MTNESCFFIFLDIWYELKDMIFKCININFLKKQMLFWLSEKQG